MGLQPACILASSRSSSSRTSGQRLSPSSRFASALKFIFSSSVGSQSSIDEAPLSLLGEFGCARQFAQPRVHFIDLFSQGIDFLLQGVQTLQNLAACFMDCPYDCTESQDDHRNHA